MGASAGAICADYRSVSSVRLLNVNPQRFVNDVVKPWDELNALLSQRYAFQPDLSDVTRLAGTLAVAIKHQADLAGYTDRGNSSHFGPLR